MIDRIEQMIFCYYHGVAMIPGEIIKFRRSKLFSGLNRNQTVFIAFAFEGFGRSTFHAGLNDASEMVAQDKKFYQVNNHIKQELFQTNFHLL